MQGLTELIYRLVDGAVVGDIPFIMMLVAFIGMVSVTPMLVLRCATVLIGRG